MRHFNFKFASAFLSQPIFNLSIVLTVTILHLD